MLELLKRAQLNGTTVKEFSYGLFQPANSAIANELVALWQKYHGELIELSDAFTRKYSNMVEEGFVAAFGDVEGELLYILIRELKPDLVYEISPNSGCSTNYLLAAVTKNGNGRVEAFELEASFNGIPTREAIARNQIHLCDMRKYNVNIGDARNTVAQRLKIETPNFCLIDSWHEDIFADFYIHQLFPRVKGTVMVQDIAHFDPRPEWSTEAAYLLTHLQLTSTEVISIATYEDILNESGVRSGLAPRRAKRSNSIIIYQGDHPAAAAGEPAEYYRAAWRGNVHEERPAICDILSIRFGRARMSDKMARALTAEFGSLDACTQALTIELLAKNGHHDAARRMLLSVDVSKIKGAELPLSLMRAACALSMRETLEDLHRRVCAAAVDPTLATGYRQLLELADLRYAYGYSDKAQEALSCAIDVIRNGNLRTTKVGIEFASFCLSHPRHFRHMRSAGFTGDQIARSTATAGRAMLRSRAARTAKRLLGLSK